MSHAFWVRPGSVGEAKGCNFGSLNETKRRHGVRERFLLDFGDGFVSLRTQIRIYSSGMIPINFGLVSYPHLH